MAAPPTDGSPYRSLKRPIGAALPWAQASPARSRPTALDGAGDTTGAITVTAPSKIAMCRSRLVTIQTGQRWLEATSTPVASRRMDPFGAGETMRWEHSATVPAPTEVLLPGLAQTTTGAASRSQRITVAQSRRMAPCGAGGMTSAGISAMESCSVHTRGLNRNTERQPTGIQSRLAIPTLVPASWTTRFGVGVRTRSEQ